MWTIDQFQNDLGNIEIRNVQFGHPKTLNETISLAVEHEAFDFTDKSLKKVGVFRTHKGSFKY